ncbi:MAG: ABC transporter ATP-binding protein [Intestinibacter sp.]|uniref:ABC transporter ATP-binding protein n=1 Tax=Intestinibacter sp. TaxID=1965304 RepID=UPI0025B87FB5|nr:ABC transporter ATP-binding protein [Intestinibacter sp.]MCI6738017.1 ABC transporter ATP-binding protein [Intestinibacter sp.]
MEEIIKVNKLCKSYGEKTAVDNLNLSVKPGTVVGILGANGAGKSTSIECILGTKKSDSGNVSICGMNPIKDRKKLFEKIGVQFQDSNYQSEIRVDELCEETACIYKNPADWRELLKEFGISDKERNQVKSLSGGERQRLFIVLALIPQPEVVFLDELTTGLDARARREVWRTLEKLKKDGLTIILTSHFMDEVEILCDEILILNKGKTVFYGTVEEAIKNSPCDKFEDAYLWYSDEEGK